MSYLLASILWGLAGFVTGLIVGHFLHLRERPHLSTGAFLILLAVALVVTGVIEQAQRQHDVDCQLETNQAFRAAIAERTAAAKQDREALKQLVGQITVGMRTENDEAVRVALESYRATVEANEVERADQPLPETDCG